MSHASADKISRARALLAVGQLSQRSIALQVGLSHSTVTNIANRKPPYDRVPDGFDQGAAFGDKSPVETCPGCGAKVRMPCYKCSLAQRGIDGPGKVTAPRVSHNDENMPSVFAMAVERLNIHLRNAKHEAERGRRPDVQAELDAARRALDAIESELLPAPVEQPAKRESTRGWLAKWLIEPLPEQAES